MDLEELGENHVTDAKGSTRRSEERSRHPGSLDWPRSGEAGGHGPLFPGVQGSMHDRARVLQEVI